MPQNSTSPENATATNIWFESWFDTTYYHVLYKDRDYAEAQLFMENITQYLNLPEHAKILDLACGKGRHSIYLNQIGYDVTGADLSKNSIEIAKLSENSKLHFNVHDMREPFQEKFDLVLNLFTSFGYFDSELDNLKTLIAIKESLTDDGFAVIDFMNVDFVLRNLVKNETKTVDSIDFNMHRKFDEGYISKEISFVDNGQNFLFTEKVKALTLANFEQLMDQAGIYLLDIFGDYKLNKFDKNRSERLIMIFK